MVEYREDDVGPVPSSAPSAASSGGDSCAGPFLITGAAGFIGRRLALWLRSQGLAVRVLVRPGHDVRAVESAGAETIRGDAADHRQIAEAAEGCRVILHLASARGRHKLTYRDYELRNGRLAEAVAAAAVAAGGVRVVLASTAQLTGHQGPDPQTEATTPRPNSGYRASKHLAERILGDYAQRKGLDVVVARVCQRVLGPGAREWTRVVIAVRDRRVRVLPDGGTIHSGDVDDIVDGLWRCAVTPEISGERFLLGAERPLSTFAVLRAIAEELRVDFAPHILPAVPFRAYVALGNLAYRTIRRELPHHYTSEFYSARVAIDIGRAQKRLGYAPHFDMRQSIGRTVSWLREHGLV